VRVEPKVVCFDADQTLIDFRSAMRKALQNALLRIQALASDAETLTVQRLIEDRDAAAAAMGARASMEAIRREGFRRSLVPFGVTAEVIQSVTDDYLTDRFRLARPYDDVIPALDALQERYALGLATNGNSYPDRAGLAHHFAFTVYAHDCGYRKPDPEFFEIVRWAAEHEASEIVYVGDSLADDIVGAKRAGFKAVWINRENASDATTPAPDAGITSLLELPELLDSL
jgi:putative hydrolase of the HAD superfamily